MGLGVGEGDPDLVDFILCEIIGDVIDVCPQESNIAQRILQRRFCTGIHAVVFDIDANVVDVGVEAGQPNGVIAFSAGKFNHDGVVVAENLVPIAFYFLGVCDIEGI